MSPRQSSSEIKVMSAILEQYPCLQGCVEPEKIAKFLKNRFNQYPEIQGRYEVDDVIHEVCLRLEKAISSGKQIHNLEAWIRATGVNVIREFARKQKKVQIWEDHKIETKLAEQEARGLDEDVGLENQKIRAALEKLKRRDREILELKFFMNLTSNQIAQRLTGEGKPINADTVRQQQRRALARLREIFLSQLKE